MRHPRDNGLSPATGPGRCRAYLPNPYFKYIPPSNSLPGFFFFLGNECLFPVQNQTLDKELHHPVSVQSGVPPIGTDLELEVFSCLLECRD